MEAIKSLELLPSPYLQCRVLLPRVILARWDGTGRRMVVFHVT